MIPTILVVIYAMLVVVTSYLIGQTFGIAAQIMFMLPVFLVSLALGAWIGSHKV